MSRYDGKPLLRLLECYVLAAIGRLDDKQSETLRRMEPKLASVYNRDGTWIEIIQSQMEFPESLPLNIREIWERNLEKARLNNLPISPEEFALAFVDQNFS